MGVDQILGDKLKRLDRYLRIETLFANGTSEKYNVDATKVTRDIMKAGFKQIEASPQLRLIAKM